MERKSLYRKELRPTQTIVLSFAVVILIGTLLLMLPNSTAGRSNASFIDALFTATSAVCVTGLAVVDTGTYWSTFGQLVIMILIQVGGLGFMTLTTTAAIFLGKKIGLRNRILMQEALNQFNISGVIRLTKYVFVFTVVIEGIGALLLSYRFIPQFGFTKGLYYSIFHSISAFCNAGFDIMGNGQGLTGYAQDPFVSLVIMSLFVIGGLGFAVLADLFSTRKYSKMSLHTKLVLPITAGLLVIGWLLMLLFEYNNALTIGTFGLGDKLVSSLFLSATPRTAGFNTLATEALTLPSKVLTMLLMFIGGSPGSTAGGIKTTTFALMFYTIISVIRGREDIQLLNRRISKLIINKGLAVIFVSSFVIVCMLLTITYLEPGFTFDEITFEVFSGFGTAGLSLGITPALRDVTKLLMVLLMFFGRIGPLTIVLAISAKGTRKSLVRYPEGKIIVG